MIVTAKVRIEHYLCKQKLTIHYTTYFCHEGCLPSQIFGLLLPISPKSRSNVALLLSIHSQQWVCLWRGRCCGDNSGKNGIYSRAYTERVTCNKVLWQMLSELFHSTPQGTPASKFASLELSPTAPTGKAANDSQKSAQMGPGGFCFFPAGWILFYILPLVGYKQLGMQSFLHLCVLENKSV